MVVTQNQAIHEYEYNPKFPNNNIINLSNLWQLKIIIQLFPYNILHNTFTNEFSTIKGMNK